MIIKGKSRSGPIALAKHLMNAEANEQVTVLDISGTVARDLRGALIEMEAVATGTRCQKPLYHAAISPAPPHKLTARQRAIAVNELGLNLGLMGHARAIIIHEKHGREHIHVVWSRIDTDTMRSVSDSHNYRIHETVARRLERQFSHERVQGAHVERDGPDGTEVQRPDRTPSRAELRQEERTGIKGKDVKREVTEALKASDNAAAFQIAVEERGYLLAQGDRRDFVIVDRAGGIHSLARRIDGMKAAELRAFMSVIDRSILPSAEQAHEAQIERAITADLLRKEEIYAKHDAIERNWQSINDAHDQAALAKDYAAGDDYVSQTQAAAKEHKQRQEALNSDELKPTRPSDEQDDEKDIARKRDEDDKQRMAQQSSDYPASSEFYKQQEAADAAFSNVEITERLQRLRDRYAGLTDGKTGTDHSHDAGPDKQREAPGGGRTRGR